MIIPTLFIGLTKKYFITIIRGLRIQKVSEKQNPNVSYLEINRLISKMEILRLWNKHIMSSSAVTSSKIKSD